MTQKGQCVIAGLDRAGGSGVVRYQNDEAVCTQGGPLQKEKKNFEWECSMSFSPAKKAKSSEFNDLKSFWSKLAPD